MATRPVDTASIEKGTGRSWAEWLAWLESIDAGNLPHKEIAARIMADGLASGWWAQSVTVAYEQQIGRRVPGQDEKGRFQVAVSRTLPGTMDEAMGRWAALVPNVSSFDGVAVEGEPRRSTTEKWRHWRASLADGTSVIASATAKGVDKATLTLSHEKLGSPGEVERWRAFWKELLSGL